MNVYHVKIIHIQYQKEVQNVKNVHMAPELMNYILIVQNVQKEHIQIQKRMDYVLDVEKEE